MGAQSALGRTEITSVQVVVPAHDEQDRIGRCLTSVRRAVVALQDARSGVATGVLVVLDRCADATATVAATLDVPVIATGAGCVGAARAAGVDHLRAVIPRAAWGATLVANTDADCVVPDAWLVDLVELAESAGGHDLVLGEVEPDPAELSVAMLAAWWERHPRGRGSLHGANLAVRLDAYVRAGGFPAVPEKEDVLLVRALRADGARVIGGTRVTTSARREGRVADGFAGYLRSLDAELATELPLALPAVLPLEAAVLARPAGPAPVAP